LSELHQTADDRTPDKRLRAGAFFLLLLALLGATAAVYAPGLGGPFLLDDLADLRAARFTEPTPHGANELLFAVSFPYPAVRGLGRLSLALTDLVHGPDPRAYKVQNLLLHLLNGLLICWLLVVLLRHRPPRGLDPAWIALATTAFWLLHPLQVSTVLYAVQRYTLLVTVFMLAAVLAYAKGRVLSQTRPWAGALLALAGFCLFVPLGLLTKENAALTPLLMLVVELYVFRLSIVTVTTARLWRTSLPAALFVAMVAAPILVGGLFLASHFDALMTNYQHRPFTMSERLLTQIHALALYIKQAFLPLPATMSLFHDDFSVTRALTMQTILTALALFALIAASILARRRIPWLGFGILWFFACHALESSFLGLELVFEHRNYIALVGPTTLVAVALSAGLNGQALRGMRAGVILALAALLGFNTAARAMVWGDQELMLITDYQRHPRSPRVLSGLFNIAVARNDKDQALRWLSALQEISEQEAAPFLGEFHFHCDTPPPPPTLVTAAERRLTTGIISPFTVNSLRDLTDAVLLGKCSSVTDKHLRLLFGAAKKNPRLNISTSCYIREIEIRHLLSIPDIHEASASLRIAIAQCRQTGPKASAFIIQNLLTFALDQGRLADTVSLFAQAAEAPDKSDITIHFPPWLAAEMITPGGIKQLRAQRR
jgi:protein O-mannosyl-transferase